MSTISALVHTLNEEDNIRACLDCLAWCDEIVVVDMMSDDRTVEIARHYTDRVYSFPRMGLADPARKFGVEKTTGDWVLIVDADELIPWTLMLKLREIADSRTSDVVFLPEKTYMLGEWIRHTAWWPEYHPRFFRKGTLVPNDRVHTSYVLLSDKIMRLEASETLAIHHFAYRDSHHFVHKSNNYTDKEAEAFREEDGRGFSLARLLLVPIYEFLFRYVYKKGFLDGMRGLFLSSYMAFYRFLAEAKLWERRWNADPDAKYRELKQAICDQYKES